MLDFALPEQLLEDCHHLGSLRATEVLLNRNAALPWFILVPRTALQDMLDLPEAELRGVMTECVGVSAFIKQKLGYPKVNFAGLGNVVPDMHLHIIGRREGDLCWPQPVWGNLSEGGPYALHTLREWQRGLVEHLGLNSAALPD